MIVVRTRSSLAEGLSELRAHGPRVGLVPTMGYLHEGHLSLVEHARGVADVVATSIFVNPLQFGPTEDLDSYPRDEARDLELLADRGTDLVFAPSVEEMYPRGEGAVTVDPGPLGDRLCGAARPGHFRGVLTVVAKLFGLVEPDVAVFGRKDFQQAVLIRRMAEDLDLGVEVVAAPIVREPDGLAMSSRNTYLSPEERADAVGLSQALAAAGGAFAAGERRSATLLNEAELRLSAHPLLETQYLEAVDPVTLKATQTAKKGTVVAVAAFCGRTRLIDNIELG